MIFFCTFPLLKIRSWLLKASSFDDQILFVLTTPESLETHIKMFYNENDAHNYLERILDDPSYKINYR